MAQQTTLEGPTRHKSNAFTCPDCEGDTDTLSYETARGVWWHQCTECGELKEDTALVDN